MYTIFDAAIQFRDRCYGGIPKTKELLDKYIKAVFAAEEGDETYEHVARDVKAAADEKVELSTCGFRQDERGIYLGDYQIKAMMKQAGQILKLTSDRKRGIKTTLQEGLYVKGVLDGSLTGDKLYFLPLRTKADGSEDFAGHVTTPRGPRSILRRCEFIERGVLEFQIWVLTVRFGKAGLTEDNLRSILELGCELGLGSCRSLEKGKFDILKFERQDIT